MSSEEDSVENLSFSAKCKSISGFIRFITNFHDNTVGLHENNRYLWYFKMNRFLFSDLPWPADQCSTDQFLQKNVSFFIRKRGLTYYSLFFC